MGAYTSRLSLEKLDCRKLIRKGGGSRGGKHGEDKEDKNKGIDHGDNVPLMGLSSDADDGDDPSHNPDAWIPMIEVDQNNEKDTKNPIKGRERHDNDDDGDDHEGKIVPKQTNNTNSRDVADKQQEKEDPMGNRFEVSFGKANLDSDGFQLKATAHDDDNKITNTEASETTSASELGEKETGKKGTSKAGGGKRAKGTNNNSSSNNTKGKRGRSNSGKNGKPRKSDNQNTSQGQNSTTTTTTTTGKTGSGKHTHAEGSGGTKANGDKPTNKKKTKKPSKPKEVKPNN